MPCRTEALTVELDTSIWPFIVLDCAMILYGRLSIHELQVLEDARKEFIYRRKVRCDSESDGDGDDGLITVKSRRCFYSSRV